MSFIRDNIPNFITLVFVFLLLYICARSLYRSKKSGTPCCGCGKNCASCALRYVHGMAEKKI